MGARECYRLEQMQKNLAVGLHSRESPGRRWRKRVVAIRKKYHARTHTRLYVLVKRPAESHRKMLADVRRYSYDRPFSITSLFCLGFRQSIQEFSTKHVHVILDH